MKSDVPSEEKIMIIGRRKQNNGYRRKKTEQISDGKFIYQYRLKKVTKI
jgi:hypothetical protein